MKKLVFVIASFMSLILFSSCGSTEDLSDYVEVTFSGVDTMGVANYAVNEEKLFKEIFDYDEETDFVDEETEREMDNLRDAYKIKLDKDEKLSNGDKIKVNISVNEEKTDKIKGGDKEVVVADLEEPKALTSEDVEKNLVLNFNGASGKGLSQIDNSFKESPLSELEFEIESDGELKNGDQAKVVLNEDAESVLNDHGYILEEDFNPTFEVKNLYVVAEKATDIKNLKDIKRMIEEEVKREYKSFDPDEIWGYKYKINQEKLMYRQFSEDTDNEDFSDWEMGNYSSGDNHGNLIGIYSVKKISGDDNELMDEFTAIIGFSDIKLDNDKKANVSEIEKISDKKDETYSLESVIQLYEGEGYTEVKK